MGLAGIFAAGHRKMGHQRGVGGGVVAGLFVLLLPVVFPTLFAPFGHASPSIFSVSSLQFGTLHILVCENIFMLLNFNVMDL